MKKKKKYIALAIFFAIGTIGCLLPNANALEPETIIEYEGYDLVTLSGNITLSFICSDTGTNDLDVDFSTYVYDGENITGTVFLVTSEEITYDWRFINNTKSYIFYDESNNLYRFDVDYSSIAVPLDPELVETRDNLTIALDEIDSLNLSIISLDENISLLKETIKDKQELYDILKEEFKTLNNSYILLEHKYNAQKDVNEMILNTSMIAQSNYGIQLRENEVLNDRIVQLEEQVNSPLNYAFYPVMLFIGAIGLWEYQNHKNGKNLLGKDKNQDTHKTQHYDSSELNNKIKDEIQEKKKMETETPKDVSVEKTTPSPPPSTTKVDNWEIIDRSIDEALFKKNNSKIGIEIV